MEKRDLFIPVLIVAGVVIITVTAILTYTVSSKHPKAYVPFNLPVLLYPYVYMLVLLFGYIFNQVTPETFKPDYDYAETIGAGVIIFLTIHPFIIGALIGDILLNRREKIPAVKAARFNMLIKLIQVPAYIFHFILGVLGSFASIWGIGFVGFAIIIDLITIFFTGTQCLAAIIGICKQKGLLKWQAILFAILSYIYCIDVAISIVMFVMVSRKMKAKDSLPE